MFSYDITLEFSEAIFGVEKEFELSHLETCEVCTGTGGKIGSKMRICSTCGGRGQVMRTEQTPFGLFSQVTLGFWFLCLCWFYLFFFSLFKICICILNQNHKNVMDVMNLWYIWYIPQVVTAKGIFLCLYCIIQLLAPYLLCKNSSMIVWVLCIDIRFLYVQIVVETGKSFLNTVGNALVKDVFVLRKILKLKFLLVLALEAFWGLLERETLGQEGRWFCFTFLISITLFMCKLDIASVYEIEMHERFI